MRAARALPLALLAATLLLLALGSLDGVSAGAGATEEGDPDCDKATGWEALENPEPEEGCVWDIFTAVYEWGEVKVAEARILWRTFLKMLELPLYPPPPPPPPPQDTPGCMEGWAGAECDECAPGYSGEDCDQKEL
jgi:hypothetical protein